MSRPSSRLRSPLPSCSSAASFDGQHALVGANRHQRLVQAGELRALWKRRIHPCRYCYRKYERAICAADMRTSALVWRCTSLVSRASDVDASSTPAIARGGRGSRTAARQWQVPGQVMLTALHAERAALHRAGADTVAALVALGPAGAAEQPGLAEFGQQCRVLHAVQQGRLGVGEHHRVAAAGALLVEVLHLHLGDAQHFFEPLLALAQPAAIVDHWRRGSIRVQPILVQAALPRACRRRRQRFDLAEAAHPHQQRGFRLGSGGGPSRGLQEVGDSHFRHVAHPRSPPGTRAAVTHEPGRGLKPW